MSTKSWPLALTTGLLCVAIQSAAALQGTRPAWDASYSDAQAARGEALYGAYCANCHGKDLQGGVVAPPAGGSSLVAKWQRRPLRDLFEYVQTRMPYNSPNGLTRAQNADIVAYMLKQSQVPSGPKDYTGEMTEGESSSRRGVAFYTAAQAARGKIAFDRNCGLCHSTADSKLTTAELNETGYPSSFAAPFLTREYYGKMLYPTVYHLYTKLQSMPAFDNESISNNIRTDIIAHILQRNGFPAGKDELKPDVELMGQMMLNEPGFERIFNGKDFSGIKFVIGPNCGPPPGGCGKTDPGDEIHVAPGGRMFCKCNIHGYWYYADKKLLNFTIRFQHKFVKPEGWIGDEDLYMGGGGWLMFIQDSNMRVWPKTIEIEGRVRDMADIFMLGGGKGKFTYDHAAKTRAVKPFDWNDIEIVSKAGQVKTYVNGVLSSTITEHDYPAGYFGMQMEGSPTEWRNIRIKSE